MPSSRSAMTHMPLPAHAMTPPRLLSHPPIQQSTIVQGVHPSTHPTMGGNAASVASHALDLDCTTQVTSSSRPQSDVRFLPSDNFLMFWAGMGYTNYTLCHTLQWHKSGEPEDKLDLDLHNPILKAVVCVILFWYHWHSICQYLPVLEMVHLVRSGWIDGLPRNAKSDLACIPCAVALRRKLCWSEAIITLLQP